MTKILNTLQTPKGRREFELAVARRLVDDDADDATFVRCVELQQRVGLVDLLIAGGQTGSGSV